MKSIPDHQLSASDAALWWPGQEGYVVRTTELVVAIDPYLSDSAATGAGEFSRLYPAPINPAALSADIYIVTHDHPDHLDPGTISLYTVRIEPGGGAKTSCKKAGLIRHSRRTDCHPACRENWRSHAVGITGVFALSTSADVLETTGYLVKFGNSRSFYYTSDTAFHPLVLAAAPKEPEVMLVPINGKWGNPGSE